MERRGDGELRKLREQLAERGKTDPARRRLAVFSYRVPASYPRGVCFKTLSVRSNEACAD